MKELKHNYKLNDEEFLAILRKNCGLFGPTAIAIQKKYKIPFSRQAVRDRANKYPELLQELQEEGIDQAHLTFLELMKQTKDPNIRFKAARFYAQTKGKVEFNIKEADDPEAQKVQAFKIGETILRFVKSWNKK